MNANIQKSRSLGFGLVELMVGMVIGLLATLVIMQVFSFFEGQKRTTTGGADAQTNANVALYSVQRETSMAGYGLPVFSIKNPALRCDPLPTFGGLGIFPVLITEGGAGASDTLTIRYGETQRGGIPINGTFAGTSVTVVNNMGCQVGDTALIVNGSLCAMQTVSALPDNTHITLVAAPAVTAGNISCMGPWNEVSYTTAGGGLTRNGVPSAADVVSLQAQYGLTAAPAVKGNNTITEWADAAAVAPDLAMRLRIRAVRIALITRNGAYEKDVVSYACNPPAAPLPIPANQTCIWTGDAAPVNVDLSGLGADWNHYRYTVLETIIPLRNLVWSSNTL
ncbi:MAG: PilW family protein [Pseudomonadota bacterium]